MDIPEPRHSVWYDAQARRFAVGEYGTSFFGKEYRSARSGRQLGMHQASFRIDLRCNPLLSEKEQGGSVRLFRLVSWSQTICEMKNLFAEKLRWSFYCMGFAPWKKGARWEYSERLETWAT